MQAELRELRPTKSTRQFKSTEDNGESYEEIAVFVRHSNPGGGHSDARTKKLISPLAESRDPLLHQARRAPARIRTPPRQVKLAPPVNLRKAAPRDQRITSVAQRVHRVHRTLDPRRGQTVRPQPTESLQGINSRSPGDIVTDRREQPAAVRNRSNFLNKARRAAILQPFSNSGDDLWLSCRGPAFTRERRGFQRKLCHWGLAILQHIVDRARTVLVVRSPGWSLPGVLR